MANKTRDAGKERFWRGAVRRQAASKLGVRAFCRREKLTESAFYFWRRTIAARDAHRKPRQRPPAFVPVVPAEERSSEPAGEASLVIELLGGRMLRLPESIAAQRLTELVQALEAGTPR